MDVTGFEIDPIYYVFNATLDVLGYVNPNSLSEARQTAHAKEWEAAAKKEMDGLISSGAWKYIPASQTQGHKIISSKMFFEAKSDGKGGIAKFKARLVVRGFMQEEGEHFMDTFAPVPRFSSLRMFFSLAAAKALSLFQFDVKQAFLQAFIEP